MEHPHGMIYELEIASYEELPAAVGTNHCCGWPGIIIEHAPDRPPSEYAAAHKLVTRELGEREAAQVIYLGRSVWFYRNRIRVVVCSDDQQAASGLAQLFLEAACWDAGEAARHVAKFTSWNPPRRWMRRSRAILAQYGGRR